MSPQTPFERFDLKKKHDDAHRRRALAERSVPASLTQHAAAARTYQADAALADAVNVALAVGAPLLLTGEPGTGKTQLAHHLAWYFHLEAGRSFFPVYVRSTTTAEDLLYRFDAVAYLHAAQDPQRRGQALERRQFIEKGALWQAYLLEGPSLVLLDEIDKAPRDFPNDLLNILDKHEFEVRETGETIRCRRESPPVVIITSNSERRLPEPFLRRCVVHHINFTEELVRQAVAARGQDFANLAPDVRDAAIQCFLELRGHQELRKRPATAELLAWLTALAARGGVTTAQLDRGRLGKLPALSVLIKDHEDVQHLQK